VFFHMMRTATSTKVIHSWCWPLGGGKHFRCGAYMGGEGFTPRLLTYSHLKKKKKKHNGVTSKDIPDGRHDQNDSGG